MLKKLLPCDLTLDRIHHKIAKIEFLMFHKYHNAKVRYSWFFLEIVYRRHLQSSLLSRDLCVWVEAQNKPSHTRLHTLSHHHYQNSVNMSPQH